MEDRLKKLKNSSINNNAEEEPKEFLTTEQIADVLQQAQNSISEWSKKNPSEALWFINEVQYKIDNKIDTDQLKGLKPTIYDTYTSSFFNRTKDYLNTKRNCKPIIIKADLNEGIEYDLNNLSTLEVALRHWYLVNAKKERFIIPADVGKKYAHLKDKYNVAKEYGKLNNGEFEFQKYHIKYLLNVKSSLKDYEDVQKAIENDIDRLK